MVEKVKGSEVRSAKLTGVTVLVCTYNGEKTIGRTLKHLSKQITNKTTEWEILVINNSSTDCTRNVATAVWSKLGCDVAFSIRDENKRGKENAVDTGLLLTKYCYAIICDDDNFLADNYVQNAFDLMERNPEIGILGGKGIAEFESQPPKWFDNYLQYYAVGEQHNVNYEVKHYWPRHRFIWGAGSVVNVNAFLKLRRSGFDRILKFNIFPRVARSEDIELCYAIWLAGYKVWYNDKLQYQHFITTDRLNWSYLINLCKQTTSALHYLRPYNILMFTGVENAPKSSYWFNYIIHFLKAFCNEFAGFKDFKLLIRLLIGRHKEDSNYFNTVVSWYSFYSVLMLGWRYNSLFKRVSKLQQRLAAEKDNW